MAKTMKFAIIKMNGKAVGRAELVYFPKVHKNVRSVDCHGITIIEEDD